MTLRPNDPSKTELPNGRQGIREEEEGARYAPSLHDPDRPFHNFRAIKCVDRQTLYCTELLIDTDFKALNV